MKNYLILICFLLVFNAFAQTKSAKTSLHLSETSAESQGISPERLDRIDAMLKEAVADKQIPGAVALIARNGKIVFHNVYGKANNSADIERLVNGLHAPSVSA